MKNPNSYTKEQRSLGGLNKPRREERFEEVIARFHDYRKGHVIAHGVTYTARGSTEFKVQHSTKHAKQFDVVCDGRVIKRGNPRNLPCKWIRKRASEAKEQNTTYVTIKRSSDLPRS